LDTSLPLGDRIEFGFHAGAAYYLARIDLLAQEPSRPALLSVRKAIIDFSGFSLNLGLILRF
jgi:hypothetical protein